MKQLLLILMAISVLSGCTNERKVTKYLDKHPEQASKIIAARINLKTDTLFQLDSASYFKALLPLMFYIDSLTTDNQLWKSKAGVKVNIDSLRSEIKKRVMATLKPCVDSIKTIQTTIENKDRINFLEGQLDLKENQRLGAESRNAELQEKLDSKEKEIDALKDKVKEQRRGKAKLWILIIILLFLLFRKPIIKLLSGLI